MKHKPHDNQLEPTSVSPIDALRPLEYGGPKTQKSEMLKAKGSVSATRSDRADRELFHLLTKAFWHSEEGELGSVH